jgi:hypothetical protein
MTTARMAGGTAFLETIGEIDGELTNVIRDFMRVVDVEAVHLAKNNGKHSPSKFRDCGF